MFAILTLFVCIVGLSFLSSLIEAVFMSVTQAYVALSVKANQQHGIILDRLKDNIDRPITAILTFNTITNTAGSAVIGAWVYELYGNEFLTLFSVILTIVVLIFCEIFPKVLGATFWKELAPIAAYAIQFMIILVYPFVWISEHAGKWLTRPDSSRVTREEMIITAELGAEEGAIAAKESTIIKNLLMLNKVFVSDIMTPRSVIFALEAELTVAQVVEKYKPIRSSRVPVYRDSLDHVIGMTHRYKILEALSADQHNLPLEKITTPIQTVRERMTVAGVIDFFIRRKEHMALVIDEYGVVTGLVTLEDAIETLLGVEIMDEFDNVADMRQFALDQWQQRKNQLRRS
jgi:CBS domain containing-hemolysin-like protein